MKIQRLLLVAVLALLVPSAAFAQQRFEVAPFVAWQHGNEIFDQPTGGRVDVANGAAYGFIVDVSITDNLQAEFIYNRRSTTVDVTAPPQMDPVSDAIDIRDLEVIADYYQGGIVYKFDIYSQPKLKPFIGAALGASSITPNDDRVDVSGTNRFSWSVTGGLKYFFTENVGFRGEYRLFSTRTDFVQRGYWCDWWGWCWSFSSYQNLWQSQLTGALVIGF